MLRICYVIWLWAFLEVVTIVSGSVEIIDPTEEFLNVNLASSIDVKCSFLEGSHVTWFHNGRPVDTNTKYTLSMLVHPDSTDKQISVLTLKDAANSDSGLIICRDSFESSYSDQIIIYVTSHNYIPTVEIIEPNTDHISVSPGRKLEISCLNNQGQRISWYHNGKRLLFNGIKIIITGARRLDDTWSGLITVKNVGPNDAGVYFCREDGNPQNSDQVIVTIEEPHSTARVDIVEPSLSHITLRKGSPLHLKCTASKSTHIRWLKDGIPIQSIQRNMNGYIITQAVDGECITSLLSREVPVAAEESIYTCINLADSLDRDQVTVMYGGSDNHDYKVATQSQSVVIVMQSSVRLQCNVVTADDVGYLVMWTRAGQEIYAGEKYIISNSIKPSTLTIKNTDKKDIGQYKCHFLNSLSGETEGVVIFNVTGTPCPPLVVPHDGTPLDCSPSAHVGDTCTVFCEVEGSDLVGSVVVMCDTNERTKEAYWSNTDAQCTAPYAQEAKGNIPFSMSNVLLRAGDSLGLDCGQSGVWTLNGERLTSGDKYSIVNSTLTIHNTVKADAAVYSCTLHNKGHIYGIKKFNVSYMECRALRIPDSGYLIGCSKTAIYGDTCYFQCNAGFQMFGSPSTSCELYRSQTQTYWTSAEATCTNGGLIDQFNQNSASCVFSTYTYSAVISIIIYLLSMNVR